ncbi:hypothetical protein ACFLSJ_08780 [Verrucomicrobiota bacterium]
MYIVDMHEILWTSADLYEDGLLFRFTAGGWGDHWYWYDRTSGASRVFIDLTQSVSTGMQIWAWAGLPVVSGDIRLESWLPDSFVPNSGTEDSEHILLYLECWHSPYTWIVPLDIGRPGTFTQEDQLSNVRYASYREHVYFLHFDPVGTPEVVRRRGSVTFPGFVAFMQVRDSSLDEGDGIHEGHYYAGSGPVYPGGHEMRGLELNGQDSITLSADLRTVTVDFQAGDLADQVRIFVNPVP